MLAMSLSGTLLETGHHFLTDSIFLTLIFGLRPSFLATFSLARVRLMVNSRLISAKMEHKMKEKAI